MAKEIEKQTPYQLAWSQFKKESAYLKSENILLKRGMKQPYINNLLEAAFSSGYTEGLKVD